MKLTICVLLGLAAYAAGGTIPAQKGWYVPLIDGKFSWVSAEQYDLESSTIQPRASEVKFYLYTQSSRNSPQQLYAWDSNGLKSSNWNSKNPTRFIIHGWQNDYKSDVNQEVRSALLDTGAYNVICVDWSSNAGSLVYSSARSAVPDVGAQVGNFINFLNQQGSLSLSKLAIIGHSLGAHAAGYAGKSVSGTVQTIVGLDPAGPLYSYSDCSSRLCSSDASFVESIQTNGGTLGFVEPIGKAAFYPNGGKSQPGCGLDVSGSCAHSRSYIYYAESLRKNNFPAMKCSSYQDAVKNNCGSTYSSVRMGAASNYGISGYYYVPVNSNAPYGKA